MNCVRHGSGATFETKSSYCRVARLGFKRRATAVLKSNLIRSIEFGTAVARRLKRASPSRVNLRNFVYEKNVKPFARANSVHACSDCLALT